MVSAQSQAGGRGSGIVRALSYLLVPPLFLRPADAVYSPHDAQDLTQGFFFASARATGL